MRRIVRDDEVVCDALKIDPMPNWVLGGARRVIPEPAMRQVPRMKPSSFCDLTGTRMPAHLNTVDVSYSPWNSKN